MLEWRRAPLRFPLERLPSRFAGPTERRAPSNARANQRPLNCDSGARATIDYAAAPSSAQLLAVGQTSWRPRLGAQIRDRSARAYSTPAAEEIWLQVGQVVAHCAPAWRRNKGIANELAPARAAAAALHQVNEL